MITQKPMDTAGAAGLPFVRRIVRGSVEELFREQPQRKMQALVDRVLQVHRNRGGTNAANAGNMVWRVLNDLKKDGLVDNHAHGYWLGQISPRQDGSTSLEMEGRTEASGAGDFEDEAIADLDGGLRPEKEIGSAPGPV